MEWTIRVLYILAEAPLIYLMNPGKAMITQAAMDLSPHSTASPFPCLEETWNLIFCMKCGISFWQKWYGSDRQGSVDDIRSSYNHLCTPNEGFETLKQQWTSLLAAQYSIYCAERWLKIWYFAWTSRAVFTSKWDGFEHEGCVDAAKSSSNLAYH